MNEETLRAQHPELYAAVFAKGEAKGKIDGAAEGSANERKRVLAHLKLAKSTGAVDVANAAIASGASTLDEDVHADYMSAAVNRSAQSNRQAESVVAGAALDGTNGAGGAAVVAVVAPDLGDQVVAQMSAARGKKVA